jgi:hypothetical protein
LLRDAERDGWLDREQYRDAGRKPHERWALTAAGCAAIGVAPTAPTAPTYGVGAAMDGAGRARQPRQPAVGGYGGKERAQNIGVGAES